MSEQTNQPKDELIGKVLGQYEVLEEVGRGGMATVYRARQLSMNRIVAVKVLPRHLLHDPGFFERFEREVDVVAHLEHPHILPIYDYGKAEGVPYIAMRYLAGGSLAQVMRRGIPKLEDLERPMMQVGQALDYAHQQGIIHRDIKPGNIMLDENGNAYLSDFGIARVLGSNLTGSAIIGTPAYMSPEQANGFPLDARSDIYSLGIVLFELITGREPYQAETPMALLLKHINEPIPPVSQFRQGVPPAVEQVIFKATAKDPNVRHLSAGDMAQDFSDAVRGLRQGRVAGGPIGVEDAPTIRPDALPRPTPYPTPYGTQPTTPPYPGQPQTPYPPTPYPGQPQTPYPTAYPPGYPPPTSGPITPPPAQAAPNRLPLAVVAAGIVLLLIVGAVFVLPGMLPNNDDIPVTRVPEMLPAPTVFPGGQTVSQTDYSLAVPAAWHSPSGNNDVPGEGRVTHVWNEPSGNASVSLALVATDVSTRASFEQAANAYRQQYYAEQENLTPLDSAIAPDGTLRYSYRRTLPEGQTGAANGQVDVFYVARGAQLVVLEFYSADSTGNTLVSTFQQILDSLQVKVPAA